MKIAKNNLDVQIALLESKLGIDPNIHWCVDAVKNPKVKKLFDDMSPSAMEEELERLRSEKAKQKLYWIQKELNRTVKKAKAFLVQKIVKKVKMISDEVTKESLEASLKSAKSLNHVDLASQVYHDSIINSKNEYIRTALQRLDIKAEVCTFEGHLDGILQNKSFQSDISLIQKDLESFLRRLLHEQAVDETKAEEGPRVGRAKIDKERQNESYFVSSLNTDGESLHAEPKRKNRMGQKARRAMAEARYGQKANHLKAQKSYSSKDSTRSQSSHPKYAQSSNKFASNDDKNDKLHPSWQAKQLAKQKEQNAHFQGTKKVFEDE